MGSGELSVDFSCLRVTWTMPDFFELFTKSGHSLQSSDFAFADGRYCLRLLETQGIMRIELLNLSGADPGRAVLYDVQVKSRTREIDTYCETGDTRTFWVNRITLEGERDVCVPDGTLTVLCSLRPRQPSGAGSTDSGGDRTRVIPQYRAAGTLSYQSLPSLSVTWRIPGCFPLSERTLESPEFPFSDRRYRLRLSMNCLFVDMELVSLSDAVPGRSVSYEVGLKSTSGEEIDLYRWDWSTTRQFRILRCELESKISKHFPDGHLTVFCCMGSTEPSSAGNPKSGVAETAGSKVPVPQAAARPKSVGVQTSNADEDKEGWPGIAKLQSDLKQLLQKVPDSDACLVVCGKEFRAHQNILRARSTVFDAMFGHETAERESGRVVIDDLDPESFGHFLEYLYTGVVGAGLSGDDAFGLYEAADKYDVPTLKAECVKYMRRSLSVDSFCDVLAVALRHAEEELLSIVVLFFKENMARIIVTAKWKQFAIDDGASANELFIKAVVPPGQ